MAGPHISPRLTAVEPESGVGAARIGVSLASLDSALAPALLKLRSGGSYAFGPLQVDVRAGSDGRVNWVADYSAAATIDGHRLSQRFGRLRVALQSWKASFCGSSGDTQVLTHGSSGLWTRIEFAGGHFQNLTVGRPNADPCL